MDTATHFAMGISLGGLALVDPVIATDTELARAAMAAAIIGSQIPDIDTIFKLQNNAKYIKNHRGATHSIPAILIWPFFITFLLGLIYRFNEYNHIIVVSLIAVVIHVGMDILNGYGTQALKPFSNKWLAIGAINTFDSFIFFLHISGIFLWLIGLSAVIVFPLVYTINVLYIFYRFFKRQQIVNMIKSHFKDNEIDSIVISSTMKQKNWKVAVITNDYFYVAEVINGKLIFHDEFERIELPDCDEISNALTDENIKAFLSFSPVFRWEIKNRDTHTEVKFIDLRYRSKNHYPFVAVVLLDNEYNKLSSYTGWIFSEEKLRKKLEFSS
ncbi:MAG: hypothetical protein K0S34_129 [Bacillales bacterium]|nr:hypothetical protein [Bacillales bacterium]